MPDRTLTHEEAMDNAPPPPYTDLDSDSEDDFVLSPPQRVVINATRSIKGVGNLVAPISPSVLSDAGKFSALLLQTVQRLNEVASANGSRRRRLRVDLTVNCGVEVVGHKNAVGFGVRPGGFAKVAASTVKPETETLGRREGDAGLGAEDVPLAGAGVKRKVDDEVSSLRPLVASHMLSFRGTLY